MTSICNQCRKEYENKRNTSRFCSAKCRVYWHRNELSVTKKIDSVTENAVTVTQRIEKRYVKPFDNCSIHGGFYQSCINNHPELQI